MATINHNEVLLCENHRVKVIVQQKTETATSVTYRVRVEMKNQNYWGGRAAHYILKYGDGAETHWACPVVGQWGWSWNGSNYVYGNATLAYEFWPNITWAFDHDCTNWIAAWYLDTTNRQSIGSKASLGDRTVSVSRGANERQARKTLTIGLYDAGGMGDSCYANWTVYGKAIADPSNLSITVTVDPPTQQNRKIRITVSFDNPSNYYTGKLTGPGLAASGITSSYSTTQDVTYNMFKTTRKYTFVVTGADGTSKTVSKEVYIEPGGVGIWHKQNNQAKECFHVYYKNELGEIIEATEAWYRRNSQNIQTIK